MLKATVANMRAHEGEPGLFAYSPTTRERCSATPDDYFHLTDDDLLLGHDGEPMFLATQSTQVHVLPEDPPPPREAAMVRVGPLDRVLLVQQAEWLGAQDTDEARGLKRLLDHILEWWPGEGELNPVEEAIGLAHKIGETVAAGLMDEDDEAHRLAQAMLRCLP